MGAGRMQLPKWCRTGLLSAPTTSVNCWMPERSICPTSVTAATNSIHREMAWWSTWSRFTKWIPRQGNWRRSSPLPTPPLLVCSSLHVTLRRLRSSSRATIWSLWTRPRRAPTCSFRAELTARVRDSRAFMWSRPNHFNRSRNAPAPVWFHCIWAAVVVRWSLCLSRRCLWMVSLLLCRRCQQQRSNHHSWYDHHSNSVDLLSDWPSLFQSPPSQEILFRAISELNWTAQC